MIQVLHCSEIGDGRENEDAFAVRPHPADPACWLCAVADGQGGQPLGGPAARLASRYCLELASGYSAEQLTDPDVWAEIVREVDQAVADDPDAGLTTLVAFAVVGDELAGASSGDSAAVAAPANEPPVILTQRQFKNPPVGSSMAIAVGFRLELVRPWAVLAMTDGVWKYAGWDKVLKSAADGDTVLDTLRDAARLRSGRFQDDFTLVVLRAN
jgi:PPM family protein phosphatase